MKKFCLGIGNAPPLRALLKDPEFTSTTLQRFAADLLMSENAFSPCGMPVWNYYQSEINRAQQEAELGGRDPREA